MSVSEPDLLTEFRGALGRNPSPIQSVDEGWVRAHLEVLEGGFLGIKNRIAETELRIRQTNGPETSQAQLTFNFLTVGGVPVFFRRPLTISADAGRDEIIWEVPELGLVASGSTDAQVQEAIEEQLTELVEDYARAPDEVLSPSGLRLKQTLVDLLGA